MNAVEGFFGKLAHRRLSHGIYDPIGDIETATRDFIELHNVKESKP